MKSKLWLNLALLVVVILLSTIVIFKPGVETENKLNTLTNLKANDIQHILIQRKHGLDIEFIKQDQYWRMIQPVGMPADNFRLNSLLNLVETSVYSQHNLLQLDSKTYGLDSPRATLILNHKTKIYFGATEALHKRRYLSIEDNLFTTDDLYYYQMAADFSLYLDPALLPPDSKIKQLRLPDFELIRKEGSWLRQPMNPQLSVDTDVELIDTWQNAAALKIELVEKSPSLDTNVIIYLENNDKPLLMYYHTDNDHHYLTRFDNSIRYTIPVDIAIKLALHNESGSEKSDANTGTESDKLDN